MQLGLEGKAIGPHRVEHFLRQGRPARFQCGQSGQMLVPFDLSPPGRKDLLDRGDLIESDPATLNQGYAHRIKSKVKNPRSKLAERGSLVFIALVGRSAPSSRL